MSKCKCKETECEECPEWIFTLADLIMCMMGLFVILWVLKQDNPPSAQSPQQDQKLNEVVAEIRKAFGYVPDPDSSDPIDMLMLEQRIKQTTPLKSPGDGGRTKIERKGVEGTDPEVTQIRAGKTVTVGGRMRFELGAATLSEAVRSDLDQVAEQIRGHRNIVMLKGHASLDDLPEGATPIEFMDLSLRRAQAVADYLTHQGVSPDILRVQGCSTFEPVRQRAYTAAQRAENRRVEVEATAAIVADFQESPKD